MSEKIIIRNQQVSCFIGVPDKEIAVAQCVEITTEMTPKTPFSELGDDIENTVDYFQVYQDVLKLASERPRRLIETLVHDLAKHVVEHYPVANVKIRLEKFILPNTSCVEVSTFLEAS